jgi:hypothetical protein
MSLGLMILIAFRNSTAYRHNNRGHRTYWQSYGVNFIIFSIFLALTLDGVWIGNEISC